MAVMTLVYLVQHAEKEHIAGDPGISSNGVSQAHLTGCWLRKAGIAAIYSSPLRRAHETADCIAAETGLHVAVDVRLRERVNWDVGTPAHEFCAQWTCSTMDRDYVPASGESSRQAGDRLCDFLLWLPAAPAPVGVVTHGGVTVDVLRTLLPDALLPAALLEEGVPPCAVTTIDGLKVLAIADTRHLASRPRPARRHNALLPLVTDRAGGQLVRGDPNVPSP